jgi:hypothetical protein
MINQSKSLCRATSSPVQLIGEARQPIPAKPGQTERYDCEYRRNGTANLVVFLDVNRPWRKVKVTQRRAAEDFATCMRELADVHYPEAEHIRLVLDNLSTHSAGALYQTFPADEARRVLRRSEFHYVPKHASWLNMVEIEIGVLAAQCLDRRIESYTRLVAETAAWEKRRNAERARINWMFTTEKPAPKWAALIQNLHPHQAHIKESRSLCRGTSASALGGQSVKGSTHFGRFQRTVTSSGQAAITISARFCPTVVRTASGSFRWNSPSLRADFPTPFESTNPLRSSRVRSG